MHYCRIYGEAGRFNPTVRYRLRDRKRNGWCFAILVSFIAVLTCGRVAGGQHKPAILKVSEVSLGIETAPGMVEYSRVISPDHNHVACVVRRGNKKCVVLDGVEQKLYPDIPEERLSEHGRASEIVFSLDGLRIAYVASRGPGDFFVVVDGVEGKSFDSLQVGAPMFSPNSKRIAYVASRGGKEVVVADGVEGKAYDYIGVRPITFSADSKHLSYSGVSRGHGEVQVIDGVEVMQADVVGFVHYGDDGAHYAYTLLQNGSERVVIDGVEGPEYFHVMGDVEFSRDGRHSVYLAGQHDGEVTFLVLDGVYSKKRASLGYGACDVSPDGRAVAELRGLDSEYYIEIGELELGPYDSVPGFPVFSADGKRFLFVVEQGSHQAAVVDGVLGPYFDAIRSAAISPAGNSVLYVGSTAGKDTVFMDGVSMSYDQVGEAIFSPDGRHIAISARTGRNWSLYMDGAKFGASSVSYDQPIGQLTFSPDGRRIAFVTGRGRNWAAVVDGVKGKRYASIDHISFSNDSKDFAYQVLPLMAKALSDGPSARQNRHSVEGHSERRVVFNGAESAQYDSLMTEPVFDQRGSVDFLAIRSGKIYRVRIRSAA